MVIINKTGVLNVMHRKTNTTHPHSLMKNTVSWDNRVEYLSLESKKAPNNGKKNPDRQEKLVLAFSSTLQEQFSLTS